MPLLELLILVVIAGIIGAIAEFLIGFAPGELTGSVIIGVLGVLIGQWLALRLLHLPEILSIRVGARSIELVWGTLGTLLLVAILSLIRTRRFTTRRPYSNRKTVDE